MMNRERMTRMSQTMGDGPTSIGLSERTERALAYLFGWVTGLIFFIFERKNRNVQYHAKQSMAMFIPLSILWWLTGALAALLSHVWVIGFFLGLALGFVSSIIFWVMIVLVIVSVVMAWFNPNYRFPFVSNFLGR